jgi:hypothetical protein
MSASRIRAVVVGMALALPACSFSQDALWPSLTGEDPNRNRTQNQAQAQQPASRAPATSSAAQSEAPMTAGAPPPLGTGDFRPSGVTPGTPTGTFVGKQVSDYRGQLEALQKQIADHNRQLQELRTKMVQDSQRYHGTVAAINARLQVGTTPGNPILVQQFNGAQTELDRLSVDIDSMNRLATGVSSDSTLANYLSESTQAAFGLSGAVDEDHAQLAVLQDEINRTTVLIERLFKEVTDDVRRQTAYVSTERGNLNLLSAGIKTGEIYGASLVNRAMSSSGGGVGGDVAGAPADTTGRRPLVVIRFDRENVPYQQALYNAVSRVLERRPNAVFDLVAVSPSGGGQATVALNQNRVRRSADTVLRSLVEMGLPPSRVAVSGKSSPEAQTNEVHLYLR